MIDFKVNGEDFANFYKLFNQGMNNTTLYELDILSAQYYEDTLEFVSWLKVQDKSSTMYATGMKFIGLCA